MSWTEEILTCVRCPQGCRVFVRYSKDNGTIDLISGHQCEKGKGFVIDEVVCPKRILVTSLLVERGEFPLVSVKSNKLLQLEMIPQAMARIQKTSVKAPVKRGEVLIKDIVEGVDIIATRSVRSVVR